jgi:protein-disulfide isomerase
VNTGQVRFLFKDFTINDKPGNKASTLAAEASYCAADQGKYWQYHDEIQKAKMLLGLLKIFLNNLPVM